MPPCICTRAPGPKTAARCSRGVQGEVKVPDRLIFQTGRHLPELNRPQPAIAPKTPKHLNKNTGTRHSGFISTADLKIAQKPEQKLSQSRLAGQDFGSVQRGARSGSAWCAAATASAPGFLPRQKTARQRSQCCPALRRQSGRSE